MMTERGQCAAPGQAVLRVCRQRDNRWCLQFLGLTAASYLIELGFGRIGTTPWNDLVGVACYLAAHPDRPHWDKPAHARPRYSRRQT